MQLLPDDLAKHLPPLYSQEGKGEDAIGQLKFFTPWTSWTWYASEHGPEECRFFGVVVGYEREYGYFSLNELGEIRGPGGLTIERDVATAATTATRVLPWIGGLYGIERVAQDRRLAAEARKTLRQQK